MKQKLFITLFAFYSIFSLSGCVFGVTHDGKNATISSFGSVNLGSSESSINSIGRGFKLTGFYEGVGQRVKIQCQLSNGSYTNIAIVTVASNKTYQMNRLLPEACIRRSFSPNTGTTYETTTLVAQLENGGQFMPIITRDNLLCMGRAEHGTGYQNNIAPCLAQDRRMAYSRGASSWGFSSVPRLVNRLRLVHRRTSKTAPVTSPIIIGGGTGGGGGGAPVEY